MDASGQQLRHFVRRIPAGARLIRRRGGQLADLSWRDAIIDVLRRRGEQMHYAAIAEAIAEGRLRTKLGATPASTVNATITVSLQKDKAKSPFMRVGSGTYALRTISGPAHGFATAARSDEAGDTGLINAFGMYWRRNNVDWTARTPKFLGEQQPGSTPVDFSGQKGVYLLHDGRAVVYVGRTTDQPLGVRLKRHVSDRLNGRWDRFSWFGVYPVAENGTLKTSPNETFDLEMLIVTMEALLIEGLEPPQNRKRGDDFKAVEFLQIEDPDIQKKHKVEVIEALKAML